MKNRKKTILTDFLVIVFILQSVFVAAPLDAYAQGRVSALRPSANSIAVKTDIAKELKSLSEIFQSLGIKRIEFSNENLLKIITSRNLAETLRELDKEGYLEKLIPPLAESKGVKQGNIYKPEPDAFEHTIGVIENIPNDAPVELRLAAIFHDIAKPQTQKILEDGKITFDDHDIVSGQKARAILKALGFDRRLIEDVVWLATNHMFKARLERKQLNDEQVNEIIKDNRFPLLMMLTRADIISAFSHNPQLLLKVMNDYAQFADWITVAKDKFIFESTETVSSLAAVPKVVIGDTIDLGYGIQKTELRLAGEDVSVKGEAFIMDPEKIEIEQLFDEDVRRRDAITAPMISNSHPVVGKLIEKYVEEADDSKKIVLAFNGSQGHFWDPNSLLIIDGQLVAKQGGARGFWQQEYTPLNGKFWVLSFDRGKNKKKVFEIELKNGEVAGGLPVKDGIAGQPLLINGKSMIPKLRFNVKPSLEGNELNWSCVDQRMAMSAIGYNKFGKLIRLTLVGDSDNKTKKEASILHLVYALKNLDVVDAVLLGTSGDVQEFYRTGPGGETEVVARASARKESIVQKRFPEGRPLGCCITIYQKRALANPILPLAPRNISANNQLVATYIRRDGIAKTKAELPIQIEKNRYRKGQEITLSYDNQQAVLYTLGGGCNITTSGKTMRLNQGDIATTFSRAGVRFLEDSDVIILRQTNASKTDPNLKEDIPIPDEVDKPEIIRDDEGTLIASIHRHTAVSPQKMYMITPRSAAIGVGIKTAFGEETAHRHDKDGRSRMEALICRTGSFTASVADKDGLDVKTFEVEKGDIFISEPYSCHGFNFNNAQLIVIMEDPAKGSDKVSVELSHLKPEYVEAINNLSSADEAIRIKAYQTLGEVISNFAWRLLSQAALKEISDKAQVVINNALINIMKKRFDSIQPRMDSGVNKVLNPAALAEIQKMFEYNLDGSLVYKDGHYRPVKVPGTYSTLTEAFPQDIQNRLKQITENIISAMPKGTAVYGVLPHIYHISVAVLQDSALGLNETNELSNAERESLIAIVKDIASKYGPIALKLKGIRFGDDGGIIAVWQDNGETELIRKEFFERGVLITPKIRNTRPKPFLYTTLARILSDISPETLDILKQKAEEVKDLSKLNLTVTIDKLRVIYETKWMGEEYNDIETIEFGNSKASSAGEALVVTIDGPSGAGKSTAAKEIAKRLQARFISYGKYYRLITWLAINKGIKLGAKLSDENKQTLVAIAESVDMSKLNNIDYGTRYNYKGKDITDIFYSKDVADNVAFVSQVPEVRKVLVAKFKALVALEKRNGRSSVLEGRVTGVEIAPDADVKIFLTANLDERAERRAQEIINKKGLRAAYTELVGKKPQTSEGLMRDIISAVKLGIQTRDYKDKTRKHAPAVVAVDAINIDSSRFTKEQTADTIVSIIRKHKSDSHYKFAIQEASGLKDIISGGRLQQFIIDAESLENRDIAKIAHMAANLPARSVVFIAGYSCSGKTTFATRLKKLFQLHDEFGKTATELNIDRYYRNHEDMRKDKRLLTEGGLIDFDAPEALDLDLVASHISKLVAGETIDEPDFDIAKGIRTTKTTPIRMEENSILFVEGTHALHPLIVSAVNPENKLCIFVTVTPRLRLSNNTILTPEDSRLMRRIVRDAEKRGIPAINTLRQWPIVLKAEAEHILPTIDTANLIEDTALAYEAAVLKKPLMVYLKAARRQAINEPEIVSVIDRLMGILGAVPEAGYTNIPANSILREFISEEPISEDRIHGFIEKSSAIMPLIENVRIDNQILQAA